MSVFLDVPEADWVASNAFAFAFRDRYPVSLGHTLVVTRRVVADWFGATDDERRAVFALVDEVKRRLDQELQPDGYNVGFNAGAAAGQTVPHLHVHVIPRYRGDMDDPRGGVRHVIPSRGNYLRDVRPLATGGDDDPFARHVLPLFDQASDIAIVAAFVQESGVRRIARSLRGALDRGARVRVITGDYLEITQASALELLLDWQSASGLSEDDDVARGRVETRVVETSTSRRTARSFHPKSWRFEAERFGVAFVGSSNLSRSALDSGVEWNLRVDRDRDSPAYGRVRDAFESVWRSARVLDATWISEYAERARRARPVLPPGEIEADDPESLPIPHAVQLEALAKLREARAQGRSRALVVLATGLGKTWLAVFDYQQLRAELGSRPRLLFLAHRREILRQAAGAYRTLLRDADPQARISWFAEQDSDLGADLVFASVAKLARRPHLERLRAERFDYVVVDEVHHAAADSYRKILDALDPGFLLGLTATPDRADTADILGLFDDHLAYRADVARGVELGRLVPFHYFGVRDDIDYEHIPWRNQRFDPDALAAAAQTEARMDTLWRAWTAHPGERTLIFCCSIAHATYVRGWLRGRGLRASAVFSGEGSDDRESSLRELTAGALDAVCAVDVFNEGVDVPAIDRVVMLRPTESGVVFVQQLGRGLRASEGKHAVTVIDFVGNHRVFLERVRTLFSLAGAASAVSLRSYLEGSADPPLPAGCAVELELEAKQLLARLLSVGGANEVERAYRELRSERGERPSAGELQRMGYLPSRLRERHRSWFGFVRAEGDLGDVEAQVARLADAFLAEVETTEMTKCFKMVALEAFIESDGFGAGIPLRDLALRSHAILRRSPELLADVPDADRDALTPATEPGWLAYWRRNPVEAWTAQRAGRRGWFRIDGDRFEADLAIDGPLRQVLSRLTRELIDFRLAQYRARRRQGVVSPEGFVCKVTWNKRDPILKLPKRGTGAAPSGETDVRLADGTIWQFRFGKEFCNVARQPGVPTNQLPDLLRRWFGPRAGQPGTAFEVRFRASADELWVEPAQSNVVALAPRRGVVAYPELRAAAGHLSSADPGETADVERVMLPIDAEDRDLFAVRVSGTSMDGGKQPLRDGDWAVMRVARGAAASALADRVVLVQVPAESFGSQYQIKRLSQRDGRWLLTSDNPEGPTIQPNEDMVPIARLERVLRPEDLAPTPGTVIEDAALAERFGVEELSPRSGRHGGHLFVFVDRKGLLIAPDRMRYVAVPSRSGETAYVLTRRADGAWRFAGVGRRLEDDTWALPEVDHSTWRAWGEGREVSRRLPGDASPRAQLAVDALLALPEDRRWLTRSDGRRARILGPAPRGGLRVDGGEGGFEERTVSLADVAWVVVADDDVREHGGLLDESRVNRLRYLDGTPKGSTRWIDTGWAIAAWEALPAARRSPPR